MLKYKPRYDLQDEMSSDSDFKSITDKFDPL